MKRTLLALLLSPLCTNAQLIEINAGLGPVMHNFNIKQHAVPDDARSRASFGYNGSMSVTVRVPYDLRVGVSVSALSLGYHYSYANGYSSGASRVSAMPVLFEGRIFSRNQYRKIILDLGIIGGVCGNKLMKGKRLEGHGSPWERYFDNTWYTYGVIASLQCNISKRFSIGGDVQPKIISGMPVKRNVFVLPVCLKGTIKI